MNYDNVYNVGLFRWKKRWYFIQMNLVADINWLVFECYNYTEYKFYIVCVKETKAIFHDWMHDIIIGLSEITNYKLGDCLKITHTLGGARYYYISIWKEWFC